MRTAESVTEGHPDKICDQISDAILDEYLKADSSSRVAVECLGGHGLLTIIGEVTSKAEVNAKKIAKKIYRQIGYREDLEIIERIVKQSPDIAMGVDDGGAGDQGIMYGFATDETQENMPLPILLSHKITKKLSVLRKRDKRFVWLGPDGKSQCTIKGNSVKVLISCQHKPKTSKKLMRSLLLSEIVEPLIKKYHLKLKQFLFNPTGQFTIGGFAGDTGLTGRKIMVDTYGGLAPAGGGAFSGKDPTKVDRSAAYMARYLAKNILRKHHLKECQVALALGDFKDEKDLVDAWMASPGHKANILKKDYQEIGVAAVLGKFEGKNSWVSVQIFGTKAPNCSFPNQNIKSEIDNNNETLNTWNSQIESLYSQGNSLINQGNAKIQQGNEIYAETHSRIAAQPYWDAGASLQTKGEAKISQANNLKNKFNSLKSETDALIEQYNNQINDYNKCID